MDLRLPHVRAFLAVAEELHFGRAAQRLGLTQPLVSRHVRGLEDELGAPLLVRTSRRVELTDAGRAAIPHARALLELADRLGHAVDDAAAGATGVVTVGFASSTIDRYMPPLIEAMEERCPGVALRTIQPRLGDVNALLLRGELDAMVMRGAEATDGIAAIELRDEPVVAAVPAGHPFAARSEIGIEELHGEALVVVHAPSTPALDTAIERRLGELGIVPASVRRTTSYPAAFAFVAAGAGISPRVPVSIAQARPGIVYVPTDGNPSRVVLLRRAQPPTGAVAALLEVAEDVLGDDRSDREGASPSPLG